jgi:hypothetical protein
MASAAKRRLAALSEQLVSPIGDQGNFENIPVLKKIAPDSNGPRVQGKVVIATGQSIQSFQHVTYLTWVTGTNSPLGIGRASAHQFAQNGARAVYICDFNDSNLETHKRELASLYPSVEVHVRQFDAADETAVKAVVEDAVKQYGRLDIFFANAGIVGQPKIFTEITGDEFLQTLKTNVVR